MTVKEEGGSRSAESNRQQPTSDHAKAADPVPVQGDSDEEGGSGSISADMHQFIGRQLRAVYDDVAKQPVPDRFLELMRQLDGKAGR